MKYPKGMEEAFPNMPVQPGDRFVYECSGHHNHRTLVISRDAGHAPGMFECPHPGCGGRKGAAMSAQNSMGMTQAEVCTRPGFMLIRPDEVEYEKWVNWRRPQMSFEQDEFNLPQCEKDEHWDNVDGLTRESLYIGLMLLVPIDGGYSGNIHTHPTNGVPHHG